MRLLCLHGPLIHELGKDSTVSFEFIDREIDSSPAEGVEALFDGPFRGWYAWDSTKQNLPRETVKEAMEYILSVVEEGPFDGVVGFSQGAALASSLLVYHHHSSMTRDAPQNNNSSSNNLFKFAVFICGGLPFNQDGTRMFDPEVDGQIIHVPSLHVMGTKDRWRHESMGLSKLCDQRTAKLYEHGQGHVLPSDRETTLAIADLIRYTAAKASLTY
ncbi:hypothetical protein VTN77DRAFT_6533 [Rasamsonia byssochlamydoides]|uniref:uncharacterized protein n=1 Tax=Rasamsonia byssochlamydoides TaxID=89139 RepID=UPI003742A7B2